MTNELALIQNIDKQLRKPRKETVFPLTPTHRKELRILKSKNIGSLRERTRTIKQLKLEEYQKKYTSELKSLMQEYQNKCDHLNKDWIFIVEKVNKILLKRKNLEQLYNSEKHFNVDQGSYELELFSDERKHTIDIKTKSDEILEDEFNSKYEKSFDEVSKRINRIEEQYEEAINFGDLEIVKQLYYTMKNADTLFNSIDKLKI